MEKLQGVRVFLPVQREASSRITVTMEEEQPEGTGQEDMRDMSPPESVKHPSSGTSTLEKPEPQHTVIAGTTYHGIRFEEHNGLLVMSDDTLLMENAGQGEKAEAGKDASESSKRDPWTELDDIEARFFRGAGDLGSGRERFVLADGVTELTGRQYGGYPAVCRRTREGDLSLSIDLDSTTERMRKDLASPGTRQSGSGTLTLREGHGVAYKLFTAPSGAQRVDLTLPDDRDLQIYAGPLSGDQEGLMKAVADCAEAVRRGPASTRQKEGIFDNLRILYLFPSLGARKSDTLKAKEMGPYGIAGPVSTDRNSVALGLDYVQNTDAAVMGIASALQNPVGELSFRRLSSKARLTGEKMSFDDSSLESRWPPNVQVFAGARQGQTLPTYASWLSKALDRLPEEKSLPTVLARLDGVPLLDEDDDNLKKSYDPISSTNFGRGWVRGEERPRIALIVRGRLQKGEPNALNLDSQIGRLKTTLRDQYGDVQFIELDQATPSQVEAAMKKMSDFAAAHPGAESLIFVGSHGSENDPDPRNPGDGLNGSLEGSLSLTAPDGQEWQEGQLGEKTVKKWAGKYLGNFSTNLFLLYCCDAGAWIA